MRAHLVHATAALLIILVHQLLAVPAARHAFLIATSPAPNSTVGPPVTSLDLVFVERVTLIEVQIRRQSGAESPVQEWLDLGESDSFSMATTGLTPGKYTVEFEAVSLDGHTVDGEYRFELALDAEPPSGLPEAETDSTESSSALVPIAAAGIGLALLLAFFTRRRT